MSRLFIPVSQHDHLQGSLNAPCVLVEYGDYECPSCGAVQSMIKDLREHFGDRIAFVFRNFPLREMHPWAEPAALVAEFADSKGKFWKMHDLLFANQDSLNQKTFQVLFGKLGLPGSSEHRATVDESLKTKIERDLAGGIRSGVNGTPTFFLNGERYDGPTDFASMAELLDGVLLADGD